MNLPQEYINAVGQLKELPVHLQTDGLTIFMLIAQLQLALRHPGNAGESADKIRELAVDLQNQLTTRVPDIKPILDRGWHPEFDMSANERIVNVHNVYTLYSPVDEDDCAFLSISSRPQDWGDPRWNYHFVKVELKYDNTIYINNAHLWTTKEMNIPELTGTFGKALGLIAEPGQPPEICDRSHLREDDFWCEEWGEMPPLYETKDEDFMFDDPREER